MRARRSRGRRAPSPGAAGKETPPPASPSACPAVSEEGWTSPNTHPLLRNREISAEAKDDPAKPLISCCQQGFCPKRWRLAPFCSSCLLQEQGWGLQQVGNGPPWHPVPKPKGQLCIREYPCLPPACMEQGWAEGERQKRA